MKTSRVFYALRGIFCLTAIAALFCLSGCRVLYEPVMHPIPAFRGKGDGNVSAGFRSASLSYAFTDGFGLSVNGHYQAHGSNDFGDRYVLEQKYLSAHAVFFSAKPQSSFEFLAGLGLGRSAMNFEENGQVNRSNPLITTNFALTTFQPNFVIRGKRADVVFSSRLAILSYYGAEDGWGAKKLPGTAFLEQGITLQHQTRRLGLFVQTEISFPLNEYSRLMYQFGNIGVYQTYLKAYMGVMFRLTKAEGG